MASARRWEKKKERKRERGHAFIARNRDLLPVAAWKEGAAPASPDPPTTTCLMRKCAREQLNGRLSSNINGYYLGTLGNCRQTEVANPAIGDVGFAVNGAISRLLSHAIILLVWSVHFSLSLSLSISLLFSSFNCVSCLFYDLVDLPVAGIAFCCCYRSNGRFCSILHGREIGRKVHERFQLPFSWSLINFYWFTASALLQGRSWIEYYCAESPTSGHWRWVYCLIYYLITIGYWSLYNYIIRLIDIERTLDNRVYIFIYLYLFFSHFRASYN